MDWLNEISVKDLYQIIPCLKKFLIIRNANEYNAGTYECHGQSKYICNGMVMYLFYSRATLVTSELNINK